MLSVAYKELKACIRAGVNMAMGRREGRVNPKSLDEKDVERTPTIFIHGQGHDASAWHGLDDEIKGPIYAIDYQGMRDGLQVLEGAVRRIRGEYARNGIENVQVNLVGHSLGGIIAAEFLRLHPEMVKGVITVGSRLKPMGKVGYEGIRTHLNMLQGWLEHSKGNIPLFNVAASHDWLVPQEAVLVGASKWQRVMPKTSHLSVLYSKDTHRLIGQLLGTKPSTSSAPL